jgi:hypothetical protein
MRFVQPRQRLSARRAAAAQRHEKRWRQGTAIDPQTLLGGTPEP